MYLSVIKGNITFVPRGMRFGYDTKRYIAGTFSMGVTIVTHAVSVVLFAIYQLSIISLFFLSYSQFH